MKPKTIKTNTRIFEVTNVDGKIYLCNLKHFKLNDKGSLRGFNNESIVRVRHYWNNTFKKIGKIHVKEMILANNRVVKIPQRENNQTD